MMQKIFSKFNIYDHVGYLLVGSIGLLVIYFDTILLDYKLPVFDVNTAIIWLIGAYFFGHIIQSIANLIIKEDKEEFSEREKKILELAKEFFKIKELELSNNEIWNLCYLLTLAKDITGHISSFNAYYSLYRGWFVIFFLESIFLFIYIFIAYNLFIIIFLLLSVWAAFLCYKRGKRFFRYLRAKVLQTFLIIRSLEIKV